MLFVFVIVYNLNVFTQLHCNVLYIYLCTFVCIQYVQAFIVSLVNQLLPLINLFWQDETGVYKNLLQEIAQRVGAALPAYTTFRSGLGHLPVFTCEVELAGITFRGEPAKSKKQAEKNAAMAAWSSLKKRKHLFWKVESHDFYFAPSLNSSFFRIRDVVLNQCQGVGSRCICKFWSYGQNSEKLHRKVIAIIFKLVIVACLRSCTKSTSSYFYRLQIQSSYSVDMDTYWILYGYLMYRLNVILYCQPYNFAFLSIPCDVSWY